MKKQRLIELILSFSLLIIFAWFAYSAFYELFIFEQAVHYPRITLDQHPGSYTTSVKFSLDIPTITSFVTFSSALRSIPSAFMIFAIKIFFPGKETKKYWILQSIGFSVCFTSSMIGALNFMSTAFEGVG